MEEKRYFLNPVTILGVIFISTFVLFLGTPVLQYMVTAIAFIILGGVNPRQCIKYLILYIAMGALLYLWRSLDIFQYMGIGFFYPLVVFMFKVWGLIAMARAIGSYTSSELMTAYRNIGLKEQFCIAIAIFFRFVPEFKHRMGEIREAAKIRNLGMNLLHPVRSFEIFLVPMIFKGLAISDIITASIITKGIEYPCKKTAYRNIRFAYTDGILLGSIGILLGVALWQKIV
ncbi:MAG: energy-coupling factor transporter transmembrane component T [Tissierellia bacterium]|nr:energy-coupling factor transporter transmembrane component T [Tissierellia bacterium]